MFTANQGSASECISQIAGEISNGLGIGAGDHSVLQSITLLLNIFLCLIEQVLVDFDFLDGRNLLVGKLQPGSQGQNPSGKVAFFLPDGTSRRGRTGRCFSFHVPRLTGSAVFSIYFAFVFFFTSLGLCRGTNTNHYNGYSEQSYPFPMSGMHTIPFETL